jgi:hypothetical protein
VNVDALLEGLIIDKAHYIVVNDGHSVNLSEQRLAGIAGPDDQKPLEPAASRCGTLCVETNDHPQAGRKEDGAK